MPSCARLAALGQGHRTFCLPATSTVRSAHCAQAVYPGYYPPHVAQRRISGMPAAVQCTAPRTPQQAAKHAGAATARCTACGVHIRIRPPSPSCRWHDAVGRGPRPQGSSSSRGSAWPRSNWGAQGCPSVDQCFALGGACMTDAPHVQFHA